MNMTWIDWTLVAGIMMFITYAAITTQRLTKSVADFLAANRCAGRYLLGIAEGEANMGAIAVVAAFEMAYVVGFTPAFWGSVIIPLNLFIALSGFVLYRYRQTRAMTMAQFFEMRYSRKFRIYSGILMWVSGTINFGVFPGVGARFFINYCGFPSHFDYLGITWTTYPVMLAILVGVSLYFTFIGGQISVLVTDFWQGFIATIVFAALAAFLWFEFPWHMIGEALMTHSAPGKSLIDPFDMGGHRDFNIWYFVIAWTLKLYIVKAWQGTQGYNCSALTAHEAKMGAIVGGLRHMMIAFGLTLIPLCAITIMHHHEFAEVAGQVTQQLRAAYPDNPHLQEQMTVTMAISKFIPMGLMGAFVAAMLGFFISTHNTYMHSWGSIFIQDIVCPLRKKPLSNKQHLRYLRLSIIFQAGFIFLFSWLYPMQDYILMFFAITGAIFLGGAGSVIIGGLYWKRGTTAAAWVAMTVGCVLSLSTITAQQIWPYIPEKVAAMYKLHLGQTVQVQGKTVVHKDWPSWQLPENSKDGRTAPPQWYVASEGLTLEMEELKVGKKALQPLPEAKYKEISVGKEVVVGPMPVTVSEILDERKNNVEYVFRGRIARSLGNSYYCLEDETSEKTIIAKIFPRFPINGQVTSFWCAVAAIISYITISLLTSGGKTINMDKLMHRGKYAVKNEEELVKDRVRQEKPVGRLWRMIGVNGREFSKVDKGLFVYTFGYSVWAMGSFIVLILLAMTGFMNDQRWLVWWRIFILIMLVIGVVGATWVSIGGLFDLKKMYKRLRTMQRNELDDGRVEGHHNLADAATETKGKVQEIK
jgi:SSS family solute:Na+ symporter